MYSFKYNQQYATLYNILYYCQCSTCFRRILRPSSGAQNCTHSIWYMSSLLVATASGSSKQASLTYTRCWVYSFQLLMMGGETAWNMYSIDSNKEYCITLHLVDIRERIHQWSRSFKTFNRNPASTSYSCHTYYIRTLHLPNPISFDHSSICRRIHTT